MWTLEIRADDITEEQAKTLWEKFDLFATKLGVDLLGHYRIGDSEIQAIGETNEIFTGLPEFSGL